MILFLGAMANIGITILILGGLVLVFATTHWMLGIVVSMVFIPLLWVVWKLYCELWKLEFRP